MTKKHVSVFWYCMWIPRLLAGTIFIWTWMRNSREIIIKNIDRCHRFNNLSSELIGNNNEFSFRINESCLQLTTIFALFNMNKVHPSTYEIYWCRTLDLDCAISCLGHGPFFYGIYFWNCRISDSFKADRSDMKSAFILVIRSEVCLCMFWHESPLGDSTLEVGLTFFKWFRQRYLQDGNIRTAFLRRIDPSESWIPRRHHVSAVCPLVCSGFLQRRNLWTKAVFFLSFFSKTQKFTNNKLANNLTARAKIKKGRRVDLMHVS